MIVNSSIITQGVQRDDIAVIRIPANVLAQESGDVMAANMVALGALVEYTELVSLGSLLSELDKVLAPRRHQLIPVNRQALAKGVGFVRSQGYPTGKELRHG